MAVTIPNHTILPRTEADIPTLVAFLQSSKLQLAINRFLFYDWPNEPAQRANCTNVIEGSFKNPNVTSLKVVNDASAEIVAHLVLTHERPQSSTNDKASGEEKEENKPSGAGPPEGMNMAVAEIIGKTVAEIEQDRKDLERIGEQIAVSPRPRDVADENCQELTWLFVKPSSRKQGIGSALVRYALEAARAAGLPLTACSEPPAHGFYLKQGLKGTKHVDIDLTQWGGENCGYGLFRISGMEGK